MTVPHDGPSGLAPRRAAQFRDRLERLTEGLRTLEDKPEETPETTLRALWLCAAGTPCSAQAALVAPLSELSEAQFARLDDLLRRRLDGTPLAHLTERQHFMGIELLSGPGALIPRRETELLGRAAVAMLRERVARGAGALALDICTGSGNLALALASHVPSARVCAADLSEEAVVLARRNVVFTGLGDRVEVRQGDLLSPFDSTEFLGRVDLLVCNPPYISSAKVPAMPAEISGHEPSLAFDGGPFGVRIVQRLIQEAPRFLRPGGRLAFEIGLGQGRAVVQRVTSARRYDEIVPIEDEHGDIRAVTARLAE